MVLERLISSEQAMFMPNSDIVWDASFLCSGRRTWALPPSPGPDRGTSTGGSKFPNLSGVKTENFFAFWTFSCIQMKHLKFSHNAELSSLVTLWWSSWELTALAVGLRLAKKRTHATSSKTETSLNSLDRLSWIIFIVLYLNVTIIQSQPYNFRVAYRLT